MLKKKILPILVAVSVVAATIASASGISSIVKRANPFQTKLESNAVPIEVMEDFKYTPIVSAPSTFSSASSAEENQMIESFADPKVDIYNKMLNTIDNFNNITLTMETSMLGAEIAVIEYQIDINSNLAYQAVIENSVVVNETYSEADNMIFVNNTARTYTQKYLPTYSRSDSPYIPLENRITTASDGVPCYSYRRNVTNCPLASYCVVPQEITFSYLKDFDKWSIADENILYLGRNCVKIIGTLSPYIAAKHNIDSFEMIVDSASGILMSFTGTLQGETMRYMRVTSCSFESRTTIKRFNLDNYNSYEEVN